MSVYKATLPGAFPHSFEGPRSFVLDCVSELLITEFAGMESSFAVTSDTAEIGRLNLWLSDVSYQRLVEANLMQPGALT